MITVEAKGSITPFLAKALAACQNPEPILRAAGTTLLSITEGNFQSYGSQFRPSPWKAKLDGSPATLKKSGTLSSSFRLAVDNLAATITNPTLYAAIHQFGGKTSPHKIEPRTKKALAFVSKKFGSIVVSYVNHPGSDIPARPFFPIEPDGTLTDAADRLMTAAAQRELQKQTSTN